jgi:hypothetical protein
VQLPPVIFSTPRVFDGVVEEPGKIVPLLNERVNS